ncbi:uncharacterized protein UTRI_03659 [Ustilago trichophora]|uniref:Uncharacterized protein n=1 Tax=Ustilago trichophora TaxID=86804 RepID=A0A5C3E4N9_9BASI|nr:uncharacterized protein UTRI_03659 [Ustilago trichophora]
MAIFGKRNVSPLVLIVILTLFNGLFWQVVEAHGEVQIGGECNWRKNCQQFVDGAGFDWANHEVTCAVPATQSPEHCNSNKHERNDFWGTCKAIGTLDPQEYGCPCGVHGPDCPFVSTLNRIFWPQNWIKDAWANLQHH